MLCARADPECFFGENFQNLQTLVLPILKFRNTLPTYIGLFCKFLDENFDLLVVFTTRFGGGGYFPCSPLWIRPWFYGHFHVVLMGNKYFCLCTYLYLPTSYLDATSKHAIVLTSRNRLALKNWKIFSLI